MTTPTVPSVLDLYRSVASPRMVKHLADKYHFRLTAKKYTLDRLFWLMIWQRLVSPGSLAQAVNTARDRGWTRQTSGRRRGKKKPASRSEELSPCTGGYCRARQRVPVSMTKEMTTELTTQLQQELAENMPGRPVYVMDGSSLQTVAQAELLDCYPPARNQNGSSHWPVLRILVLHDARTGLALPPVWGPMNGPKAVSEQRLAEQVIDLAPADGVLLGDRNFGIFATAFAASSRKRAVILRLTQARAQAIGGRHLPEGTDREVVWRPSRWDRRHHPELPADASVPGRLIVASAPGWRNLVYLFTTLEDPVEEILPLYRLRWNIETDLRSLKQTVHLHRLTSKSKAMVEKEIWAAVAAYNLVRTVIARAAQTAHVDPRRLSFAQVLYLVSASLPELLTCSPRKAKSKMQRLIQLAARCQLPQRSHRRSYPRAVWRPGYKYPARRENEAKVSK